MKCNFSGPLLPNTAECIRGLKDLWYSIIWNIMPNKAIQNKTKADQPYVHPFTMNFRQKTAFYQTLQAKSFWKTNKL